MLRFVSFAALLLGVSAAAAAFASAQNNVSRQQDRTKVVRGNNVFAFDLYARLNKKDGNLFFSPYSISSALAMTYAGAKGQTAEAMASTLHFSLPGNRLHPAFGALTNHYNNGKKLARLYQLKVANALWGQQGFAFSPEFLKLLEQHYSAGLKEVDFANATEAARKAINNWVEKETQHKIKELIQPGDLDWLTRLVLTNAIYFKSGWQHRFWENGTKQQDFILPSGENVNVAMMQKNEKTQYYDGGSFQLVTLPYEGNALSMIVLLPKKADGLAALENSLTSANLEKWLNEQTKHLVNVKLPKFKNTSRFNLKKVLSRMGMGIAFSAKHADFSGISTQGPLYISDVVHKAYVDVNEEGTEAAAATAVIAKLAAPPPPPLPRANFHADHPFVYLIRDNATGGILFMGRVVSPNH